MRSSERVSHARQPIQRLMREQRLCALSTDNQGRPYVSLVAFAASDDLKIIVLATTRQTRKYAYLSAQSRVALLVDSRSDQDSDFHSASAVTVLGDAKELLGDERAVMAKLYLDKHPHLADFVSAPDCALIKVTVDRYSLVTRFQEVTEMVIGSEDG